MKRGEFTFYIVMLAVIVVYGALLVHSYALDNKQLTEELVWYKAHRMSQGGSTRMRYDANTHTINISDSMTPYTLFSFDSGRMWYAVEQRNDSMFILGDVRKVYPGLLEAQQLIDKLTTKP